MRPNDTLDDQAIRALMESLPMSTNTPENVKSKLIDLATSPAPHRRAVRRPLFAFAMGSATVVAAIAVMTSLPATAKSWEGVRRATQAATNMEMVVTDTLRGRESARVKIDRESIHVQLANGDYLFVGSDRVRTFDQSDNLVLDVLAPANSPAGDIRGILLKELSMSKVLSDLEARYGTQNIEVGGVRSLNGRQVYDAKLQDPVSGDYGNVVVDAETDLPVFLEAFEAENGIQVKRIEVTARFNQAVKVKLAEPAVPAGVQHLTITVEQLMKANDGKMPRLNFTFRDLLKPEFKDVIGR